MLRQRKFHVLLSVVLALWTIRCGSAGKSSQVQFSVSPGTPPVITVPYVLSPTITISAPWYAFNVTVTNNSDEPVTLISLTLNVTATDMNGNKVTGAIDIDASSADFTLACTSTTAQITYTDLGTYQPGTSSPITLTYRGPPLDPSCNGGSLPNITPVLYAGGNPTLPGTNPHYNYLVQLVPNGWFGTISAPTESLDTSYYFSANSN